MLDTNGGTVLVALLGALSSFAQAVRDALARGTLRGAALSPCAEVLYESLLWTSGEDAVDFLADLPVRTRLAVEDLLDVLLDDGPELDAVLEADVVRGVEAVSCICSMIHTVTRVASEDFGRSGIDVQDCDAFGEVVCGALRQLEAA